MLRRLSGVLILLVPSMAWAETYAVGPSRTYKQLSEISARVNAGDVVELDGDATYQGGVVFDRAGSAEQKIIVRGLRVNGKRPVVQGGGNAIEAAGNHYVFEGLEITGGSNRCFFHHADDITLRDAVVHDCPKQGILGADADSGSMLLEYVEVYAAGGGTQDHQIYMATDGERYPGAVFRMQFCYLHDGNGGNNVKSRAARNEIYYNWIEGALYHELELIGADGAPEELVREDSDVVGNVLLKRNDFAVVRFGGDGTGQTHGRYRFVNNTVVTLPDGGAVFRLFDGIESLEAHNNVLTVRGGGALDVMREVEADWVTGQTTIAGQNNWIQAGASNLPAGFTGTLQGADPGFVDLAGDDLRPREGSPLVDAGASALAGPAGHEFPDPLAAPLYLPPVATLLAAGSAEGRNPVATIDIGAFELGGGGPPPTGSSSGGSSGSSSGSRDGGSGSSGSAGSSGSSGGAPDEAGADGINGADCTCDGADKTPRDVGSAAWLVALTALAVRLRFGMKRDPGSVD